MNEILNVREKVYSVGSISKKEPNDEIRITIQNRDLYVLPHKSYLNFQGFIRKNSPNGHKTENVTIFKKKIVWLTFWMKLSTK